MFEKTDRMADLPHSSTSIPSLERDVPRALAKLTEVRTCCCSANDLDTEAGKVCGLGVDAGEPHQLSTRSSRGSTPLVLQKRHSIGSRPRFRRGRAQCRARPPSSLRERNVELDRPHPFASASISLSVGKRPSAF